MSLCVFCRFFFRVSFFGLFFFLALVLFSWFGFVFLGRLGSVVFFLGSFLVFVFLGLVSFRLLSLLLSCVLCLFFRVFCFVSGSPLGSPFGWLVGLSGFVVRVLEHRSV